MTTPIISPKAMSFDEIRSQLIAYVESRPDNERWKDFMSSSTGTILIELLAGMGTFLSYHSVGTKREVSIDTALLRSTILNMAIMLGYPINRKSSPQLRLRFDFREDYQANSFSFNPLWQKVTIAGNDLSGPIGTLNIGGQQLPLSFLDDQVIENDLMDLSVVVGEWKSERIVTTETRKYMRLLINDTGIESNLTRLAEDAFGSPINYKMIELGIAENISQPQNLHFVPVNLITQVEDLEFQGALLRTHADGVLVIFGAEATPTIGQVAAGSIVEFRYVQTSGILGFFQIPHSDITLNFGKLNQKIDVIVESVGSNEDSIDKIVFAAPGWHAARGRMVTIVDHERVFLGFAGDLISASYQKKPETCCTGEMVGVFNDFDTRYDVLVQEYLLTHPDPSTAWNEIIKRWQGGFEPYPIRRSSTFIERSQYDDAQVYISNHVVEPELIELLDPQGLGLDFKAKILVEEGLLLSELDILIRQVLRGHIYGFKKSFRVWNLQTDLTKIRGVKTVKIIQPATDKIWTKDPLTSDLLWNEYIYEFSIDVVYVTDINDPSEPTPLGDGWIPQSEYITL